MVPFLVGFATGLVGTGIVTLDDLIWPDPEDGLDGLAGEEWYAGRAALRNARGCGEELGDSVLRRNWRVVEIQLQPGSCAVADTQSYRAKVRSYTLFMIPTGTAFVQCDTVYCYGPPEDGP